MSDWQPIETAPKDGTHLDLWVKSADGSDYRECGAWWGEYDLHEGATFSGKATGWCTYGEVRGDPCVDPVEGEGTVTHWMPPPEPPSGREG